MQIPRVLIFESKKNSRKHIYTIEEIQRIIRRFENNKTFICAFLTACYTGMRTGEVFALTWDDIDLEKRIIKIIKTVYAKDRSKIKRNRISMVFTRRDGTYSGTDLIKYPFRVIRNELDIKARFYDLRSSFATTSLRSGCEIKDIAEVLGHRRIETTEKYYISSTENDKRQVAKSFEKSLNIFNNIV